MASGNTGIPDLFDTAPQEEKGESSPNELRGPFDLRARLARINESAVLHLRDGASPSQKINLNLFPSDGTRTGGGQREPFEAVAVLEPTEAEQDSVAMFGHLEGEDGSYVSIVSAEGVYAIDVTSPSHGLYEAHLFDAEADLYVIRELDEGALPDCGVDADDAEADLPESEPQEDDGAAAEDDGSIVDVMVVYTTRVKTALGGPQGVRARAVSAIARGNQVLANSNLSTRLRLVHVEELPAYNEVSGVQGFYKMLDQLEAGTATGLGGLHALRDRHKADLVSLLVANGSLGGLANTMGTASPNFARLAYSVVNYVVSSSTWTLVHELGHNIGCCHETQCTRIAYARGHSFRYSGSTYKTVMVRKGEPGTRIPYFSNPSVQYPLQNQGVATGVANQRDNARVIREHIRTVANFRRSTA